jgi:anti-sigma regulatory factor (Ser/Thr protein kinase)
MFMEVGTSSVLMLPYTASSVGVARRRLMADLANAGVFETTACDAGLVLSELISNALRHATPLPDATVRVAWRLVGGCLEIAVSDGGGPTAPAVNEPGSSAIGGRGLGIVDRLSLRWGVDTAKHNDARISQHSESGAGRDGEADPSEDGTANGGGGTTVWAELALGFNREEEHADTGSHAADPAAWSQLRGDGQVVSDDALVIASSRDA